MELAAGVMTIIVAGSRSIGNYQTVARAIDTSGFPITELVNGQARGVDRLARTWAWIRDVPRVDFPAEWNLYGRRAGFLRNQQMADYAAERDGGLIVVWDGHSRGTLHMLDCALACGLPVSLTLTSEDLACVK